MNALEPLKASLVEAEFRLVIANVTTEASVLDGTTKKKFAKRLVVNQAIGLAIRICWKQTDLCNLFLKIHFRIKNETEVSFKMKCYFLIFLLQNENSLGILECSASRI